uniref:RNA polymerase II subunit B1 CTD phosphatase RPAP2 homolog n=1 Tax=Neogobius melanostomus TaxID=47308 RepID=A0A8C6U3E1_9GOBI
MFSFLSGLRAFLEDISHLSFILRVDFVSSCSRREAVKEALLEKLELEKRALQIVERLLEDSVTEDFLIDCARFIAPANYKDTVEERSIAKLCGYPICPNKLGKIPTQQYKISTKTNKVYDITERKLFCSNFCYKSSVCSYSSRVLICVLKLSSEKPVKEPVLPLVDSKAQHIIQKKITVDKLSSCLKNIVGPLGLTMSDISTDLNNLVRTFRFTNTNIIHKTPAWTLLAVMLLHLLSAVSPLIRRSLEQDSSVQYLHTLMEELQLKEDDLLSLVHMFKSQTS